MVSLHHITHAVSIVIISYLAKKYIDLRLMHATLRLDFQQLKISCESNPERKVGLFQCQTNSGIHQKDQPFREFQTQFQTSSSLHMKLPPSSGAQNMFSASSITSSAVDVDDYGRTLGGGKDYVSAGKGGNSQAMTFSPPQKNVPLMPHIVLPSFQPFQHSSSHDSDPELSARAQSESSTGNIQVTNIDLQKTSESLEKVVPSPSSSLKFGEGVKSRAVEKYAQTPPLDSSKDDSDFYLGSLSSLQAGEEGEDIIATKAQNTLGVEDSLYPHGINVAPSDEEFDGEEWEEYGDDKTVDDDSEDKPHPAFGNVSLQWLTDHEAEELSVDGSSVHCTGETMPDRMCHFSNLCFHPQTKDFVFLQSSKSVKDNVPDLRGKEALLELSTVAGHNAQYFSYTTIPSADASSVQVAIIPGTTVVFKRFKPDNVMHAFHDDLIPLWYTLVEVLKLHPKKRGDSVNTKATFPVSLFLADENSEGEFYDLYNAFSDGSTFTLNSLLASVSKVTDQNSLVCFADAEVGLSKATIWYHYGFFKPQGPLPVISVTSGFIRSSISFLMNTLTLECPLCGEGGHLVLISRKETRRIWNEMDLVLTISQRFQVKVMTVSLETHSLREIIPIIHTSRGIIGMHGSLLSLAAFLRQGSIVVELFPYAVNPDNYTPYKTLCDIPGMQITYRAWQNTHKEQSLPHPEWSPELGGIQHLSDQQQREIENQLEVPPHLCCIDPSWLYHIFQDTVINIPEVLDVISSALHEAKPLWTHSKNFFPVTVLPGPVTDVTCTFQRTKQSEDTKQAQNSQGDARLSLRWTPPWDIKLFSDRYFAYDIIVQDVDSGKLSLFTADQSMSTFMVTKAIKVGQYRVWVRCVFDGVQCPFAGVADCLW